MATTKRYDWVDAAKGLSILMVVMLYATYSVGEDTGQIGGLHVVAGYLTPFRMPDFFAISGLFLSRTLAKDSLTFFDKRVVHYAYFYLLWLVIHVAVKVGLATGDIGMAGSEIVHSLIQPYGVLWFIYVLALFNIAVKLLHTLKVPHWAALAAGVVMQLWATHTPYLTGFYAIDQFGAYFLYFYAGYALAPVFFKVVDYAQEHKALAIAGLAAWAVINGLAVFLPGHVMYTTGIDMGLAGLPGMRIVFAFLGMLAIFISAALLVRLPAMSWLAWIGARSIVLYVAFALPMTAVRLVLIKLNLVPDVTMLSIVVYAAALIGPFVLYALVQWTGYGKFLFERPSWFSLNRWRAPARPSLSPAE